MDGKAFISDVEEKLVPLSPIISHAIKKQLAEIGTTPEDMSPSEAMAFIDKMTDALELFLGKSDAVKERKRMVTMLRKHAPKFFEERSLI